MNNGLSGNERSVNKLSELKTQRKATGCNGKGRKEIIKKNGCKYVYKAIKSKSKEFM